MAALVAAGAHVVRDLTTEGTTANQTLGIIGTSVSGGFLYLIAFLNLLALVGIVRVFRSMRHGAFDETELETHLQNRGLMNRFLGKLTRAITKPWQMYPLGLLFGLGFDTASEVSLLVLAGTGAASGLPWYAVMVLPLLFAAGMSLLDCLDGLFMSVAYDWAFLRLVRKVLQHHDHRAVGRGCLRHRHHRAGRRPAREGWLGQPGRQLDRRAGSQQRRLRGRRHLRRHVGCRTRLLAPRQGRAAVGDGRRRPVMPTR